MQIEDAQSVQESVTNVDPGCQLAEFGVAIGLSHLFANLVLIGNKFETCSMVVLYTKNTTFC